MGTCYSRSALGLILKDFLNQRYVETFYQKSLHGELRRLGLKVHSAERGTIFEKFVVSERQTEPRADCINKLPTG